MTSRDELIKKYIRRQLSESEKETFDTFLNTDEQFAKEVQWASKLAAARHIELERSLNTYKKQRNQRFGKFALAAIPLLIAVGFYFKDSIKKALFPTSKEPIKTDIKTPIANSDTLKIEFNQTGTHRIDLKSPKDSALKSPTDLSVFEQKNKENKTKNKENKSQNPSFDRLQAVLSEFAARETYAGNVSDDWRKLLFSDKNYAAALMAIRQEIATTTDELMLNKLRLFGGILNVSTPEGNRQKGIIWLKAVIENGDYADYAAEFLVRTYMELGENDKAKAVLLKFPDVKEKLPVYLQKRL